MYATAVCSSLFVGSLGLWDSEKESKLVLKLVRTQLKPYSNSYFHVPVLYVIGVIAQVRDDTNDTCWVLAGYLEKSLSKPLDLAAMGNKGLDELTARLEDDQVMYGLYRTADVIDDIKTVKFVYIYW